MSSNIVLVGFKSCGKTTYGRKLASELNYHFIDTDELIAKSCRGLYHEIGEGPFRHLEKQVIAALGEFHSTVIATGGGVVLDPDNIAHLKTLGQIIYLRVPKEVIKERLLTPPLPAFLDPHDIDGSFEAMYALREPIYRSIADEVRDGK